MKVSRKFIEALKLGDQRSYKIAWQAGLSPSTLSKLVNGIEKVKPNDPRVISAGRILGLKPNECIEEV
jgi:hypothetical protein